MGQVPPPVNLLEGATTMAKFTRKEKKESARKSRGSRENKVDNAEKKLNRATNSARMRLEKMDIQPQTDNQFNLVETIDEKIITLVTGPAGSGKTLLTALSAAHALVNNEIEKIVLTRVMSTVGKDIGFLPGTEIEKTLPYLAPVLEYFSEFFGKEEVKKMIEAGVIQIVPVALLRGYTFKNAFIILDEAQNMSVHEFKTVLTRVGEGTKLVALGDLGQSDIGSVTFKSGLEDFSERLANYGGETDLIGQAKLGVEDILRSEVVRQIYNIYGEE